MKWYSFFAYCFLITFCSCTKKASISGTLLLPSNGDWASSIYLIKPRSLDEVGASFAGEVLDSASIGEGGYLG